MSEEIKEDNSCIVKAFENNPISILHEEINGKKIYWFKASDIGLALKLSNIRVSIQHYDEDEKGVRKAYTLQGEQDTIYLTSQGVYRLLYNSKKPEAKKFRKWAGDILDDIIFNESAELKRQLEHSQQLLTSTEIALEKSKENYSKAIQRNYNKVAPSQTLYVYKDIIPQVNVDNTEKLYEIKLERDYVVKIGKTKCISDREIGYNTHNFTGEIVYAKKCTSSDLLEKVVHYILNNQRLITGREWFNVSVELAIEIIDLVQLLLDELPIYSESLLELKPAHLIKDLLTKIKSNPEDKSETLSSNEDFKNVYDIFNNKNKDTSTLPLIPPHIIAKNPLDFDTFIKESCELWSPELGVLEKDFYCLSAELRGCHKLWSRNAENATNKAFTNYMKQFKSGLKQFPEYNAKLSVYIGIKPKPLEFNCDNIEFSQFVNERCKIGYVYRVAYRSIFAEFENWKKINIQDYSISMETRHTIQNLLNTNFYPCGVHLSDDFSKITGVGTNSNGVYGITLKSDTTNVGIKLAPSLKKKVIQVDLVTKEIKQSFNSVSDAAKALQVCPSVISTDIKYNRVRQNCLLQFL